MCIHHIDFFQFYVIIINNKALILIKLHQLDEEVIAVTSEDFIEVLDTWLSIYRDNYNSTKNQSEYSDDGMDKEFKERQDKGMLRVVSTLTVIEHFRNTAAEKLLQSAIECAKSGDCAKLPEIYDDLEKVEMFLGQ